MDNFWKIPQKKALKLKKLVLYGFNNKQAFIVKMAIDVHIAKLALLTWFCPYSFSMGISSD